MPVPAYIFDKSWVEGNFLIPADRSIRAELRQRLETYSRAGVMFLSEHTEVARMVRIRLAALNTYDRESWK